MNLESMIADIKSQEIEATESQVRQMETEEISILGPMNMLAFDA